MNAVLHNSLSQVFTVVDHWVAKEMPRAIPGDKFTRVKFP